MRFVATFSPARDRAAAIWLARTDQERKFLGWGGAILGATFFYLTLLAPAIEGRLMLLRTLPQLRVQAAEMRGLAAEAAELARQAPVQVVPITRESVTASLAARGMTAQSLSVSGNFAKIELDGVAFSNLMAWLDAQRRDNHFAIEEAQISAQTPIGQVNASLSLRQNAGTGKQ